MSEDTDKFSKFSKSLRVLKKDIKYFKGVGPALAEFFYRKNIYTAKDVIYTFPKQYEDRTEVVKIYSLFPGNKFLVEGEIVESIMVETLFGKKIWKMLVSDETGILQCVWFNPKVDYLSMFKVGAKVLVFGKVDIYKGRFTMSHPKIDFSENVQRMKVGELVPLYLSDGTMQATFRRAIRSIVLESVKHIESPVPDTLLKRLSLPDIKKSILGIHFPENLSVIDRLKKRLIFEELYLLQIALLLKRQSIKEQNCVFVDPNNPYVEIFKKILPFELTNAQKRAIVEMDRDFINKTVMYRLIQGDVGSGKTVVAFFAALSVIYSGHQVSLMAPTEILAEQHYKTISGWMEKLNLALKKDLKVSLLTASVKGKARKEILTQIKDGGIDIVVGTHALLTENVKFNSLGLCIVDEQHRFGVMQRLNLKKKGETDKKIPHFLVMTATPIPRTLAMTVWGDLDISIIDEFPPQRMPVETKVFKESERWIVYEKIALELSEGGQVFVVYPLLEESEKLDLPAAEKMYETMREMFSQYGVGLIHGRLNPSEKGKIIKEFKEQKINLLVSTTVIEVGIDIPSATLIVIDHAERFGLAQIHQMRGRVGRGGIQGKCLLILGNNTSAESEIRIRILERVSDGFKIAEEDLKIRGVGEIMGTRQHGFSNIENFVGDSRLLYFARDQAWKTLFEEGYVQTSEREELKRCVMLLYGENMGLISSG